ncbi:hypothetical protein HMPREF9714_02153 [Myroides odoratimimus CCUG 12901]|uniref:4-alpha-L-fucosyltransferase glycosyl transferase group 56 n=1 Tax=Myroides odoratimimus CCUG 10230 TaxID=883150 RepID=A0ABP2NBP3_9FLAO|nr:TDP-N-acetylfucosamine:lipid II N-acetylfucosaminyltransferase [Myroides odoratimimus]EHO08782.1 hypothetical protein HMPREF9714_02153 [Myroides odoratimimus CCUG 12901]EHO10188.1 hypothetical protein HMPREF9712_01293 [Myroides odoratimimus CCUG 10230]
MKVLHILTDSKFINSHKKKFSNLIYENTYLFLLDSKEIINADKDVLYINVNSSELKQYIQGCWNYDMIVTNGLSYYQALFINKLDKEFKNIYWSFFGTEVYSDNLFFARNSLLDSETYIYYKKNWLYRGLQSIYHLRFLFIGKRGYRKEIRNAMKRCGYFLWYSFEEFQFISSKVNIKFPSFIQLPFLNLSFEYNKYVKKEKNILVGNSGSEYNNHIDLFYKIDSCTKDGWDYKVLVPFSYGYTYNYKRKIDRELSSLNLDINLLTEFIPYEEYISNFEKATTAIYPSFRQMGLGNIIMCMQCGVKVYLSVKNPTYSWLIKHNFLVYSIENCLKLDIENDSLSLTEDEIMSNISGLYNLAKVFSKEEFDNQIVESVVKNNYK